MEDFWDVDRFHEKYGLPRGMELAVMARDAFHFRINFMFEEVREFNDAWKDGNLVKTVDALLDFVYVSIGTALFLGAPRRGYKGEWPSFLPVKRGAVEQGIIAGMDGTPVLLPGGLQDACYRRLMDRCEFFARVYEAAAQKEEGALEIALHTLKLNCTNTYSVAALMHAPWTKCWRHVQNANMKKERAKVSETKSTRSTEWDVVKPAGWQAPDARIAMELQLAGWKAPEGMKIDQESGKVEMV